MMYHTISKNNTPITGQKISFDQVFFLMGVFVKQFYLLPSGSLQIGDILMLCSFLYYFFIKKNGKLSIYKDEYYIIFYFISIALINSIYALAYLHTGFLKSTLYYLFNMMILMVFVIYIQGENSSKFLECLRKVLQCGLLVQALIYLLGIGKWYASNRYEGTFNDPNQYGVFVLFSVLIIFIIGCKLEQRSWKWVLLGFLLILPSASTGMLVGFFAFAITFFIMSNYKTNKKKVILVILLLIIILFIATGLITGYIKLPQFIQELSIYKRFIAKLENFFTASSLDSVMVNRGWNRIIESPEYFLFGAGEGMFDRFGTNLEIHSSVIGPLFYYGIFPSAIFVYWCWRKLKRTNTKLLCAYVALLTESFFLVNTRQPMYWMIIALAGVVSIKSHYEDNTSDIFIEY